MTYRGHTVLVLLVILYTAQEAKEPTTRLILKMKGKMPANAGEEKIQEALQKLTLALEAKVQAVCSHCTIQILRHKKTSQP
ncbi:uncharacterized protein LOC134466255 isoform X2 [Engraulis encrasicolus]|uniref:uncharacterized protein LOC134466255 isoform X2 n=1 Tax=Engraulis encrasicolus TaxID=184585 RepID=UPI002FD4F09A